MMTQMMGYRKVLSNLVCDRCKGIRVYEKTSLLEKNHTTIRLAVEKRSTTYQIPSLALHPPDPELSQASPCPCWRVEGNGPEKAEGRL